MSRGRWTEIFYDQSISRDFLIETKVLPNKFSDTENVKKIDEALYKGKSYLRNLNTDIQLDKYLPRVNHDSIEKTTAVAIIRKILRNFL